MPMSREAETKFRTVEKVVRLLAGFDRPWFVAGGWAIDLYLGRVTRLHGDVDVGLLRVDQDALRLYLSGWEFKKVEAGHHEAWEEGEWLEAPVHELHARGEDGDPRQIEFLLNESSGDVWVFRRNHAITRPLREVRLLTPSGTPFLAPEMVLLYKAKNTTATDELDFRNVRASLGEKARNWLRDALEVCHPGHPWTAVLVAALEKL